MLTAVAAQVYFASLGMAVKSPVTSNGESEPAGDLARVVQRCCVSHWTAIEAAQKSSRCLLRHHELSLSSGPRTPLVHGDGVFAEVSLLGRSTPSGDVALRNTKRLIVIGQGVAVGPIATEEQAILPEQAPELIEIRFV